MKIKFLLFLTVAIPVVFLTAGCGREKETGRSESIEPVGKCQKAPDVILKNVKGGDVRLSDFEGKVVILDFWTTWCRYCVKEIPDLNGIYDAYRSEGMEIVGISLDQKGASVVKPFLENNRINYTVLYGNHETQTAFGGINSLPTKIILDREGCIRDIIVGYQSKDVILKKALKFL